MVPAVADVSGEGFVDDGAMRRTALTVLIAALLLTVAAACGQSSQSHAASSHAAQDMAAWRALVQCLRHNGYPNAPDPVVDERGNVGLPSGNDANLPSKSDGPPAACQHEAANLPQTDAGHNGPTAEDRRLGLQLANCMRSHGVPNWPDPDPDGRWNLPASLQDKSTWAAAMPACGQFLPSGKLYGR
jgi:hypothetical protein